ncbi:hypothetical protein SBRCBS47491_004546 [Sporothrix bragantina]|uniref:Major facilitator superfamily (MFS) profile domain-containing protein n=1 Tax=Sporothrix bragantina TaxID=671064 RepID=A0ABP0BPE0_9PEZI
MAGWRYAWSLSKEEVKNIVVLGTATPVDQELQADYSHKRTPVPSASARDPLNWPAWRKTCCVFVMCAYTFIAEVNSAIVAPTMTNMVVYMVPRRTFAQLTNLIAINVLCIGVSNIFWVPVSNVTGRRPVLVIATLIMTLATMCCALAYDNFPGLLAARAVQGIGMGPSFAIPATVITDVLFTHQIHHAMILYASALSSGSIVGGLTGNYIASSIGVKNMFWICTGLSASIFLMCCVLVPETRFERAAGASSPDVLSESKSEEVAPKDADCMHVEQTAPSFSGAPMTFAQSLRCDGFSNFDASKLCSEFVGPLLMLRLPGVVVVMLQIAALVGGIVTLSTVAPQILAYPPYAWGANNGLINIAGLLGSIAAVATSPIITVWQQRRLNVRRHTEGNLTLIEAEQRLPLAFPGLLLATTGLWTFGFSAQYPSPSGWVGLAFGYAMLCYGITEAAGVGFAYVGDAYQPVTGHCLTIIGVVRAVVAFAWTFFVGTWVEKSGDALPFGIFGMLMGVFSLLSIPLWVWGKRSRIATQDFLCKAQ